MRELLTFWNPGCLERFFPSTRETLFQGPPGVFLRLDMASQATFLMPPHFRPHWAGDDNSRLSGIAWGGEKSQQFTVVLRRTGLPPITVTLNRGLPGQS